MSMTISSLMTALVTFNVFFSVESKKTLVRDDLLFIPQSKAADTPCDDNALHEEKMKQTDEPDSVDAVGEDSNSSSLMETAVMAKTAKHMEIVDGMDTAGATDTTGTMDTTDTTTTDKTAMGKTNKKSKALRAGGPDEPDSEDKKWGELGGLQEVASKLGYDEDIWDDDCSLDWETEDWDKLTEEQQGLLRQLGWTEEMWDASDGCEKPVSECKSFEDLTPDQKKAAVSLNWAGEDGAGWEEGTQNAFDSEAAFGTLGDKKASLEILGWTDERWEKCD